MKERLTNNLVFKIISVLFAVFLWWAVVNIDDPLITKNFKSEVLLQNADLITNEGKCYRIVDDTKIVSVTVKARRSVIEKMRSTDIMLTADVREMQDNMIPIRVQINGYEGNYEEASTNPRNIIIETEDIQTKTFTIVPSAHGVVSDGYMLGELKLDSKRTQIEVSGPKSSIGLINRVEAVVNVGGMTESDTRVAKLIYYDSADSEIDQSQITSSLDTKKVKVYVEILTIKEVHLEFDVAEIKTAVGYSLSGIEIQPEVITIVGTPEVLKRIGKLQIASKALKQTDLKEKTNVEVDIAEYLPEDVQLKDDANSKVVVTILVERKGTRTLRMPVRGIKIANLPEGYTYTYGPEQEVELLFTGTEAQLEQLTVENVEAVLDLQVCDNGEGTYNIKVQVLASPAGCEYVGGAAVDLNLIKSEDLGE